MINSVFFIIIIIMLDININECDNPGACPDGFACGNHAGSYTCELD